MWNTIQDVIGDAKHWPKKIRKLFWTRNLRNFDRFLICLFAYVNGLNPLLLIEWATMKGLCRDNSAISHMKFLLEDLEEKPEKYQQYFAYSIMNDRYERVNGLPKN